MIPPTINTPTIEINTPSNQKNQMFQLTQFIKQTQYNHNFSTQIQKIQKINSTFHQSSQI
jgi:hypothetical protein